MSHEELLSCRVTEDAYKTMRMLTYAVVYVGVLLSPIVVLTAVVCGWKAVEAYALSH